MLLIASLQASNGLRTVSAACHLSRSTTSCWSYLAFLSVRVQGPMHNSSNVLIQQFGQAAGISTGLGALLPRLHSSSCDASIDGCSGSRHSHNCRTQLDPPQRSSASSTCLSTAVAHAQAGSKQLQCRHGSCLSSLRVLRAWHCSASSWLSAQAPASTAAAVELSRCTAGSSAAAAFCASGGGATVPVCAAQAVAQSQQQQQQQQQRSSRAYSAAAKAWDRWPPRQQTQQRKLDPPLLNSLIKKAQGPQQLLQLVEQHGADMDPIHVSTAYSKLGQWCKDGQAQAQQPQVESAVQLLEPLVHQHASFFDGWGLANIIHACCYLSCKHTMQLLLPVFLHPHMIGQAAPQELANVLWAAAKAGHVLQDSELQQLLVRLCAQLQHAKPQEIVNSIYAAALMGKHVPDQQLQQLLRCLCAQLQDATPQNIANSIWAVAGMGKQLPDQQLQQLVQALCVKLTYADPQHISSTLYGVAEMGKGLPDQQLQQLLTALCAKLDQATPQAVANSLWVCGRYRFLPSQLLATLEQQPEQQQRLLSAANDQDVANIALACAHLGHNDQLLMAALLRRAEQLQEQRGGAMNVQELCNFSWAVAVLDLQKHAQQVLQMVAACAKQWGLLVYQDVRQLYQVHLWLQSCQLPAGGDKGLVGVLTQQQLEQCKASWEQQLQGIGTATSTQQSVFTAMQRLPQHVWLKPPALEQLTADGALSIDVTAVIARGVTLAVEVHGPTHFVKPGEGPGGGPPYHLVEGPTLYRNRALAARGYSVVSIPYWEWDSLKTQQQQDMYLQQKLEALLQ